MAGESSVAAVDAKYRTCWDRVNIRDLANIIAVICLCFHIFMLWLFFKDKAWLVILFAIIFCIFDICILLASKYRKPILYFPFVIFNAIILFIGVALIMACIVFLYAMKFGTSEKMKRLSESADIVPVIIPKDPDDMKGWKIINLTVFLIFIIIFEIVTLYFWIVIRKAQAYMIAKLAALRKERNSSKVGWKYSSPA